MDRVKSKKEKVKRKKGAQQGAGVIRFLMVCSFAFCLSFFAFVCFAQDQIVAVVNNEVITQKDLGDFVNFMRLQFSRDYNEGQLDRKMQSITSDLLQRLIEDRLILQEAKKNKVRIDESKVKERMGQIRKQYVSDAQFQASLSAQGLVLADLENKIREQMLMYAIIDSRVRRKVIVNPGDITDYYYEHIKDFIVPQRRDFDAIILEDEAQAQEVYKKFKSGHDLIDLSLQYPLKVNTFNAQAQGELRKDIDESVFSLEEGEISAPAKIQDVYYIFRLNKITPAREESFEDVKAAIYRFLFDKKMQEALVSWLDELKKHSYIKISES